MSKVTKEEKEKLIKGESMDDIQKTMSLEYANKFDIEDLLNRRLYLNDEVNEGLIDTVVYHILRYNRLDSGVPKEDRKPIILYINSPGGEITPGYSLISTITQSITPVYTVNIGECCSMGFLIFIAGEKRFSMPYSEFLLHEGYLYSTVGSTSKIQDRLKFETEQIEKMTKEYVLSHTKILEQDYDRRFREEWYFLPEEGKEIGVVDYIVGTDCTMDDIV